MGGLQQKLMTRAKIISGDAVVYLKKRDVGFSKKVESYLKSKSLTTQKEYELEMLMKSGNYLAPVVVHALQIESDSPEFLKDINLQDVLIPTEIAFRYGIVPGDELKLISTSHVDSFISDIPRTLSASVSETFTTNVAEVDSFHIWIRKNAVFNLMRKVEYNKIRIYGEFDYSALKADLLDKYENEILFKTWEDENASLVWALNLESTVMVSLFIAMTMLVSLTIVSGLMIFYDKIKTDLASFWILGTSKARIEKATFLFLSISNFLAVTVGVGLGLLFLKALDRYGTAILPDIFIDQKIPIYITAKGILIAFCIPYLISLVFTTISLLRFRGEDSFTDKVRAIF